MSPVPLVRHLPACVLAVAALLLATPASARVVYRCDRDGSISLSTAPEPGSRCEAREIDDSDPRQPNLWGSLGEFSGTLYRREQDGRTVYGTRWLPGAARMLTFHAHTPAPPPPSQRRLGPPLIEPFADLFRASARATGVDDALLRTIAHAESGFDPAALSPKGAMGVMQLMPATAEAYGVDDPFAAAQSIRAGARHLGDLMRLYDGDVARVAAAYNAGAAALERHGGIPPYRETRAYVAIVLELLPRYRQALAGRASARAAEHLPRPAS